MKTATSLALVSLIILIFTPSVLAQDLASVTPPAPAELRQEIASIRVLTPGDQLGSNAVCSEVEPNESPSEATPLSLPGSCSGAAATGDPGDVVVTYSGGATDDIEDLWKINLGSPGTITVNVTFPTGDLDIFLFRVSGSTITPLSNSSKTNTTSETMVSTQVAGIYYIGVSAYSGSSTYEVSVSATGQGTVTVNAPSNLQAQATSSSVIRLTWTDNSNNETEFRVEQKDSGQWYDIGSVAANATGVNVTGFSPGETGTFRVRARAGSVYSAYSNEASATVGGASLCVPNSTTVCLLGNRFRVSIAYTNPIAGTPGTFLATRLFQDTGRNPDVGLFGFDDPQAIEVVVRVQDTRPFANRFDVYYGGMTDFPYVVSVTDTHTGTARNYTFHGGTPAGGVDRVSFPTD